MIVSCDGARSGTLHVFLDFPAVILNLNGPSSLPLFSSSNLAVPRQTGNYSELWKWICLLISFPFESPTAAASTRANLRSAVSSTAKTLKRQVYLPVCCFYPRPRGACMSSASSISRFSQ